MTKFEENQSIAAKVKGAFQVKPHQSAISVYLNKQRKINKGRICAP